MKFTKSTRTWRGTWHLGQVLRGLAVGAGAMVQAAGVWVLSRPPAADCTQLRPSPPSSHCLGGPPQRILDSVMKP